MENFYDVIVNNNKLDHLPCPHPWTTSFIMASGDTTCCTQNTTVLGNISEKPISDIWNSKSAQTLRQKISNGLYEQAGCDKECPFLRGSFRKVKDAPDIKELIIPALDLPSDDTAYSKNAKQVILDYLEQKKICVSQPLFLDVFWLEKCNAACVHCNQDHNSNLKINNNVITNLLKNIETTNYIRFQGGEVYSDPEFRIFFNKLFDSDNKNKHLKGYIITNGSFINDKIIEEYSVLAGKLKVLLSIDAVKKENFEKIRLNLKYERIIQVIKKLSVFKKIDLTLNYCVMKSNLHELIDALSFAKSLDMHINFAAIQHAFGNENFFYDPKMLDEAERKVKEAIEYSQINVVNVSGLEGIQARLENAREEFAKLSLINVRQNTAPSLLNRIAARFKGKKR